MLVEVKVPPLAESIADVTLGGWRKQVGEPVRQGEILIDLETDKVTLEVAAPNDGVLKELRKPGGQTALAHEVIAVIDTDAAPVANANPPAAQAADAPAAAAASGKLSPAARKIAADKGLDPGAVTGTGKDGRITKADVLAHSERSAQPAASTASSASTQPVPVPAGARPQQRVAMTRLRKRAAERLLAAQHDNAMLTTFNEVDMQPISELRERYRERFEKEHGVRLGFMSFFVKAAVAALKRFPLVNASVDGDDIVYHGFFDIGIAVASERGLVVPILRDADALSFAGVEQAVRAYGEKARTGALTLDDLTGGTFTITNGGVFGSLLSTPIINPPQSAILGMHKIQDRPVAVNGAVAIRPMMYLALSYDHRIIDGKDAVSFLVAIKEQIEDPARLLLEI
ncbi:MAG: 2-oxoglutarate dehydrogenase complex dihydrolipoyllysine-residue succinyltransferase [Gammaproteobacteria bacterium]